MYRSLKLWLVIAGLVFVASLPQSSNAQDPPSTQQWYKGNLHTHSLWSDGDDFPEMITGWYAERDYHFLALTDHNILARGERWMAVDKVKARGGDQVMPKYLEAMGADWVEVRPAPDAEGNATDAQQVRLKTLAEYRSKFERPGEFLIMSGEEISDSFEGLPIHMNATNVKELLRPAGGDSVRDAIANNMRNAIRQSRESGQPILVHLNHPNFGWAITAEDLAFVLEEKFFEIYNGHPGVRQTGDNLHPSVERIWDICNTIRIDKLDSAPLMGLATDDCHNYHGKPGSQPGRGWVMVRAPELSPEALLGAMNAGEFYASSGVVLKSVQYDAKRRQLTIEIDPQPGESYTTQIVGTLRDYDSSSQPRTNDKGEPVRTTRIYSPDIGKTLATLEEPKVTYQLTGDELYVRAIINSSADHPNPSIKDQKQQAWTQPVGWK